MSEEEPCPVCGVVLLATELSNHLDSEHGIGFVRPASADDVEHEPLPTPSLPPAPLFHHGILPSLNLASGLAGIPVSLGQILPLSALPQPTPTHLPAQMEVEENGVTPSGSWPDSLNNLSLKSSLPAEQRFGSRLVNSFIEEVVPEGPAPIPLNSDDRPVNKRSHQCRLCGKAFTRKDHSQRHVRSFHASELTLVLAQRPDLARTTDDARPTPSRKPAANKNSPTDTPPQQPGHSPLDNYILYQRPSNPNDDARPYSCKICGKAFNRRQHTRRHLNRIHFPDMELDKDDDAVSMDGFYPPMRLMDCAMPTMVVAEKLPLPSVSVSLGAVSSEVVAAEEREELEGAFLLALGSDDVLRGMPPYMCLICGLGFPDNDSGRRHIAAQHSNDLDFLNRNQAKLAVGSNGDENGSVAKEPFRAALEALGRLVRFGPPIVPGAVPLQPTCQFCDHDYLTLIDAVRHVLASHGPAILDIARSLRGASELKRPYSCSICLVKFTRRDHCTRHIKNFHADHDLTDLPSLVIKTEDPVQLSPGSKIKRKSRPPPEPLPPPTMITTMNGLPTPFTLQLQSFAAAPTTSYPTTRVKKYQCMICHKRCSTHNHAVTHVQAKHPDQINEAGYASAIDAVAPLEDEENNGMHSLQVPFAPSTMDHVCLTCGVCCNSAEELLNHQLVEHPAEPTTYPCCLCEHRAERPLALVVHLARAHRLRRPAEPPLWRLRQRRLAARAATLQRWAVKLHFHPRRLLCLPPRLPPLKEALEACSCGKEFGSALVLAEHERRCGKRYRRGVAKGRPTCRHCLCRQAPEELEAHVQRHKGRLARQAARRKLPQRPAYASLRAEHSCFACQAPFSHPSLLQHHRSLCTVQDTSRCSFCGKEFEDSDALVQHELEHFEERTAGPSSSLASSSALQFPCHYCNAQFKFCSSLYQHEVSHIERGDKPEEQREDKTEEAMEAPERPPVFPSGSFFSASHCRYCNQSFKYEKALRKHEMLHETLKFVDTKTIPVRFQPTSIQNFLRSLKRTKAVNGTHGHGGMGVMRKRTRVMKDQERKCRYCPLVFKYRASLEKHEAAHAERGDFPDSDSTDHQEELPYNLFSCSTCGQGFRSVANLTRHEATHAPQPSNSLYLNMEAARTCPYCGSRFKYQKSFLKHVAGHKSAGDALLHHPLPNNSINTLS